MEEENSKDAIVELNEELKATVIEEQETIDKVEEKQAGTVKKVEENRKELVEELEEESNISNKKSYKLWIIIGAICFAIIVLSVGFALININNKNIIAGVAVDKVVLQGLSQEEATEIINEKIEEKLNTEIKIKIDEEAYSLLLSQIELKYDVDTAVTQAFEVGRNSNIFVNNFIILKSKIIGTNIVLNYTYNEELLDNVINEIKGKIPNIVTQASYCIEEENLILTKGREGVTIDNNNLKEKIINNLHLNEFKQIDIETQNAVPDEINIDDIYEEIHTEAQDAYYTTNPFTIIPEVNGVDFNLEEAKELLKEEKDEYIIPLKITVPKKTIKDIGTEAFPDLLGTCTTRYDASNIARTTNLKIATSKINGVVVMPGETFSYNKTLGKRTTEAGYKEAAGYEAGKVVQMTGGGICQISSTLYDAVVYANLDIVERHNHGFLTSYMGAGKDATVVYGALDFKFKNTRKYPVTIKASVQNGIAKVDIYGIKEEKEYDVEISTTILNYITYRTIYEDNSNLDAGVEKVTQGGMNGCKSITYKILRLNGSEISRSVLSTDTYDAMNKYVTRGTKNTAPTVAPVTPEPQPEPEQSIELPVQEETESQPEPPEESPEIVNENEAA